jgi:PII-like signaling protein
MQTEITAHKMGKLRIYLKIADKVKPDSLIRKVFPKSVSRHIVLEAKKDGLMNASIFQTHFGYSNHEKVQQHNIESDNAGLTICVELIDKREKLEMFFKKHLRMLHGKVVIYKEVEFWDTE